MKKINWTDLIISIVAAELVGALSALLTGGYSGFFNDLKQPPLSPPAIVFPIVWAILYALMGIGAYLVYHSEDSGYRTFSLKIYAIQLVINFTWSIIFFRFEILSLAAVVAVLLSMAVAAMIWGFYHTKPLAAYLNIPYLIWSLFASYLAIATCVIN